MLTPTLPPPSPAKPTTFDHHRPGQWAGLPCFSGGHYTNGELAGVEVIPVNPAYTSVLGAVKYQNQTEFSVHQAAAVVIARRGLGFDKRPALPKQTFLRIRSRGYGEGTTETSETSATKT